MTVQSSRKREREKEETQVAIPVISEPAIDYDLPGDGQLPC